MLKPNVQVVVIESSMLAPITTAADKSPCQPHAMRAIRVPLAAPADEVFDRDKGYYAVTNPR